MLKSMLTATAVVMALSAPAYAQQYTKGSMAEQTAQSGVDCRQEIVQLDRALQSAGATGATGGYLEESQEFTQSMLDPSRDEGQDPNELVMREGDEEVTSPSEPVATEEDAREAGLGNIEQGGASGQTRALTGGAASQDVETAMMLRNRAVSELQAGNTQACLDDAREAQMILGMR
jgi:hypothetical protein